MIGKIPFAIGDQVVIGIDPGASAGSISGVRADTLEEVFSTKMPPDAASMFEVMKHYRDSLNVIMTYLEQVRGYVPAGNDPKKTVTMHSMARLSRHAGVLEGIIVSLGMPWQEIAPNSWHRALRLPKGGSYAERKKAIYTWVKQRYPTTSKARCDSTAIAVAGVMKLRGKSMIT